MSFDSQCRCGTFAIGLCTECGQAVCGDHSSLRNKRRMCDTHVAAFDDERTREAASRATQDEKARQRTITEKNDTERRRIAALPEMTFDDLVTHILRGRDGVRKANEDFRLTAVTSRIFGSAVRKAMRQKLPPCHRVTGARGTYKGWGFNLGDTRFFVTRRGDVYEVQEPMPPRLGRRLEHDEPVPVEWVKASSSLGVIWRTGAERSR